MRHFYCRDALWDMFEQMANDFDCSIDYLVNEAMRHYARSKNYQSSVNHAQQNYASPNNGLAGGHPGQYAQQGQQHAQGQRHAQGQPGQGQQSPGQLYNRGAQAPAAPMDRGATARMESLHQPPPAMGFRGPPAMPPSAPSQPAPKAAPMGSPNNIQGAPAAGTLFLWFENQCYSINKDQFIIGRGSNTSDLPIKDGNISRKHAAVIRRNGTFYIKDLGSTNGIDYKGMRIDNKRVDEGDVFHLCDYELRFTYRQS